MSRTMWVEAQRDGQREELGGEKRSTLAATKVVISGFFGLRVQGLELGVQGSGFRDFGASGFYRHKKNEKKKKKRKKHKHQQKDTKTPKIGDKIIFLGGCGERRGVGVEI